MAGNLASACALHVLEPKMQLSHPLALGVAVATRQALDQGLFAALPSGEKARHQALLDLMPVTERLAAYVSGTAIPTPGYSLLLLRTGLWLHLDGEQGVAKFHAEPAGADDTTLVINESAYRALLDGSLSVASALDKGLLAVTGPDGDAATAHLAAVLAGFGRAGPPEPKTEGSPRFAAHPDLGRR